MTKLEKDLVIECLKEYEIGEKISVNAVEKVLSELVDSKEHMTNADRIRSMSDEELAEFLANFAWDNEPTKKETYDWLQSEAE